MILSKKHVALVWLIGSVYVHSFSQNALSYIPADVPLVLTASLDHLNDKVNLAQFTQYEVYQALAKELDKDPERSTPETAYLKRLMFEAKALGYNTLEPFHLFLAEEGPNLFVTLILKMGDRRLFENELRNFKPGDIEPFLNKKQEYTLFQDDAETIAWNDQVVIFVWNRENPMYEEEWPFLDEEMQPVDPGELDKEDEISEPAEVPEWNEEEYSQGTDSRKAAFSWVEKMIRKDFKKTLSSHEQFSQAVRARSDFHAWIDYDFFMKILKTQNAGRGMTSGDMAMAMNAMEGLLDLFYQDTYLSMGLNFEDGKITVQSELFVNDDMKRFYRGLMNAKLNRKFLKYIKGGQQLFGYAFFNYNLKNTIEEGKTLLHKFLLSTPEYGQLADDAVKILGIFIDEDAIANLLKGDLMIAVSGMKMMSVTEQTFEMDDDFNFITKDTTVVREIPIFTALASYGSEKDILKFIDLGLHANVIEKDGNFYKAVIPNAGLDLYLALSKGVLILTNDQELVTSRLDKGYEKKDRLDKTHKRYLCENATAFFWDIPNTLHAVIPADSGAMAGELGYANMAGKEFENLLITSQKKVADSVTGKMEFNFVNREKNALEQLFNFLNDLYIEYIGGAKI